MDRSPLETALDLASRGAYVFPCHSSGDQKKRPQGGFRWSITSTNDPARIREYWTRFPDALIALDLGKMGLWVIDPDRHGAGDGVQAWMDLCDTHRWSDAQCPRVSTASMGEHIYFRQPEGAPLGNVRIIPGLIDSRGAGGYVIAPGSVLVGEPGDWRLMAGDIFNAPPVPDWLIQTVRRPKPVDEAPAKRYEPRSPNNDARVEAYVSKAIDDEVRALSTMGKDSGRNNRLNVAAFNLGQMVAGGLLTEADVRNALLPAAEACGLIREDGINKVMNTIRSGLRGGTRSPRALPEQEAAPIVFMPRQVLKSGNDLIDAETGEIITPAASAEQDSPTDETWRHPEGAIRDIAEWIMATSIVPNWPLCIAAAVASIGALCSRHLCGPTRSGTHLFIAGIGDTAIGKDRPLKAPLAVFQALDRLTTPGSYSRVFTTGKFKSETAIEEVIRDTPARLARIDEMGQLFSRMGSRRASSHESGMASVLRELWSVEPEGIYQTSSRAGSSSQFIEAPCLTILGASTTQEFYASISGGAIENGLLNRFLIVRADPRGEEQEVHSSPNLFPEAIARRLLSIMRPSMGNLDIPSLALTGIQKVEAQSIPWAADDVRDAYQSFRRGLTAQIDRDPEVEPFLGRTAEMALRIATIHAIGRAGREARLNMADWAFGRSMAAASADVMINDVRERMSENEHQASYKLVLRLIREAGASGVRHSQLLASINGRIRATELKSIIELLTGSGKIEAIQHEEDKPPRGPHPPRYIARRA